MRYAIQKHYSRRLHYDLRLQTYEGSSKMYSWAIPKGIPKKKGIVRLAVKTPLHSYKYSFFGKNKNDYIPEGMYGAGRVELWDEGSYKWG